MTKNFQALKGAMGSRFKSPRKSPKRPSPKRLNPGRRRSGGGGGVASADGGGGSVAANIRVVVRVRPENERELAGAYRNVINVVDQQMLVFDPQDTEESFYVHGRRQGMRDLNKKQNKDKKFTFDCVFNPESTNPEIFHGTTKDLVDTVFQGYNCSVFAYGATGSGKTFTMLGSPDNPGITFLTMEEVYRKMETLAEDSTCEIGISYLEVYNETVRDLLRPDGVLNVREDGKSGVTIPGLSIHKPASTEDILRLLSFGNKNRTQHPTDANKESSRSHAVLQVLVQQKDKDAGLSAKVKVAKLSMIDLAGSEKGCVTGNKGVRFREGSNINKSLLALGNCINALAGGSKYIPYRDSKLTRLLKDSIGGNCRTVMIANVSPSSETFEDTFNTLKYADRAKKIKIDLKKNVLNVDFHVAQYAKIVEDLRGEIFVLKERIRILEVENETLKRTRDGPQMVNVEPMDLDKEGTSLELQIQQYKAQLAELTQRQHSYDLLQERLAEFERQNEELCSATAEISGLNEQLKRQAEYIQQLEARLMTADLSTTTGGVRPSTGANFAAPATLEKGELSALLDKRRQLIKQFAGEQTLLSTLTLRAHFKQQQHERADLVSMTQAEKERSVLKAAKAVEALHRKMEKKAERRDQVAVELAAIDELMGQVPANSGEAPDAAETRMLADLEMRLEESEAESHHLHEMIHILGGELEKLSEDMSVALPILTNNEKLLRAHSILGKEEKDRFDRLQAQILSNRQITWAENINKSISAELDAASSVYKQCARLGLPSLTRSSNRPASVEQRVLFGDSTLRIMGSGEETLLDNETQDAAPLGTQGPPEAKPSFVHPPPPVRPPTPPPSACTAVSSACDSSAENSYEALPATPQVTRQNSGSLRLGGGSNSSSNNTNNTSFVVSPSPPTAAAAAVSRLGEADNKENQIPEIVTTPKRSADEYDESVASAKKLRFDATYAVPVNSAWFAHRSVHVLGTPNLDRSVDSEAGCGTPGQNEPTAGLNETVTLVSSCLDRQCDLGQESPAGRAPRQLNSTFTTVEQEEEDDSMRMEGIEPMVVEEDVMPAATAAVSALDESCIPPPAQGIFLVGPSKSPVKAGMGLSPTNLHNTNTSRKSSPSPLRQSTLLDIKAGGGGGASKSGGAMLPPSKPMRGRTPLKTPTSSIGAAAAAQPINKGGAVRRNLASSQSASVLPKVGNTLVSFRPTIQRLNDQEPAGGAATDGFLTPNIREPSKYMQATASSKLKQGGNLERRKPFFQVGGGGVVTEGHQGSSARPKTLAPPAASAAITPTVASAGTWTASSQTSVGKKLGILKKSVSASVLRPNK